MVMLVKVVGWRGSASPLEPLAEVAVAGGGAAAVIVAILVLVVEVTVVAIVSSIVCVGYM